jgi:hypothetical protein
MTTHHTITITSEQLETLQNILNTAQPLPERKDFIFSGNDGDVWFKGMVTEQERDNLRRIAVTAYNAGKAFERAKPITSG